MKRLVVMVFVGMIAVTASAQLARGNRPFSTLNSTEGYITINEFNYGYGLGGHTTPYSTRFFGFTSVHGYQVNANFMLGGGTGLLFYQDGLMIPLFADFRLRFPITEFAPYISASGGMLLCPADFNAGTRMFINPAAGVRYSMSRNLGITMSGGLWIQMGANISRASFVNAKLGVVYKFN